MPTEIVNSSDSISNVFSKVRTSMLNTDFQIHDMMPYQKIVAKGKRDYSVGLMIGLIILGLISFGILLIVAIAYYFTRELQKISCTFEDKGSEGCIVTIIGIGKGTATLVYEVASTIRTK